MAVRVGINGFGRIGRQSLKALIERTPDVEVVAVNDLVDTSMNALLFKHDSTYGAYPGTVDHTDDALIIDGREIKVLKETDPGDAAVGRPRRRHRPRIDRHLHRRRQGAGPPQRGREEGDHQRPGQGRGHHDRARRERGQVRPGRARHHQQRQLHDELPGAGREGRPRPARHRARPDEHDPQLHERPADPRRRPQGPAPRARPPARTSSRRRPARRRRSRSSSRTSRASSTASACASRPRPSASSTSPPTSPGRRASRSSTTPSVPRPRAR